MKIILNIQWLLGASHNQKTMIPNALYRENLINKNNTQKRNNKQNINKPVPWKYNMSNVNYNQLFTSIRYVIFLCCVSFEFFILR